MVVETEEGVTVICQDRDLTYMGISLDPGDKIVFRTVSAFGPNMLTWRLRTCTLDDYIYGKIFSGVSTTIDRNRCHLVLAIVETAKAS